MTTKKSNLQELAEMGDRMMEVILPSITTVATPQGTEVGELKAEMASLRRQLSIYRPLDGSEATGEPDPNHVLYLSQGYVGTTDV